MIADLAKEATCTARRWLNANGSADLDNAQHVLDTSIIQWFLTCGELTVSYVGPGPKFQELPVSDEGRHIKKKKLKGKQRNPPPEEMWVEEKHLDGGASILHLGLTIFGRRDLVLDQGSGLGMICGSGEWGGTRINEHTSELTDVHMCVCACVPWAA